MAKLTFLGLGVMGFPMAGHLVTAGHDVTVWNRTASTADRWGQVYAGTVAPTIEEAVTGSDYVFMCVGNDQDVEIVATEAFKYMKQNSILIDHTRTFSRCRRMID